MDKPQEFTISLADLKTNPLGKKDLENLGIGVVGNEQRFGTVPDRAKLQRLVISADGKKVYDSESKTSDRKALETYWLVPPVHLDATGAEIENQEKEDEKYLWVVGMVVPDNVLNRDITRPVEIEEIQDVKIPDELPVLIVEPAPVLITEDENTPATVTTPVIGSNTAATNATGPPPLPNLTNTTPSTTANPAVTNIPAPITTPAVITTPTSISGSPTGTFVSTGQANPSTGLIGGVFVPGGQTNSSSSLSPFRRNTSGTGGFSPAIFNPATTLPQPAPPLPQQPPLYRLATCDLKRPQEIFTQVILLW